MKTKFLKASAALFAAVSLGTFAFAGSSVPATGGCSDCAKCCAGSDPCPVGSCCK